MKVFAFVYRTLSFLAFMIGILENWHDMHLEAAVSLAMAILFHLWARDVEQSA